MAGTTSLKDVTPLIGAAYLASVVVSFGVFAVTLLIGDISLGGEIAEIPGLPIAMLGVWSSFGAGYVLRRTRKRFDLIDKVGLGLFSAVPFLTFFVNPVREFVLASPIIGAVFVVPMLVVWVVVIER